VREVGAVAGDEPNARAISHPIDLDQQPAAIIRGIYICMAGRVAGMTIPDYVAIGVLIVLILLATPRLFTSSKLT